MKDVYGKTVLLKALNSSKERLKALDLKLRPDILSAIAVGTDVDKDKSYSLK